MADLIAEDECPTNHELQPKSLPVASSPFHSPDHLSLQQTESQAESDDSPVDRFYDPLTPEETPFPQPDAIPALDTCVLISKLSCQKQEDERSGANVTSPCEPGPIVLEKQLSSHVKHDSVQTGCASETHEEQKEQLEVKGDVKVGSLSTSVCHYSDKERNILEAPFSADVAGKEPQVMPEPDADSLLKFQFNSEIKTYTTARASPTNFAAITESKPEVVSPSICGLIPVTSSPDENTLRRRPTNKGSRRLSRTGQIFARNQKVKVQTNAGGSVPNARATNTKTWKALKTFDLVGRLAETSDVDRVARRDVDVLYSVLGLTADAGIKVAEKILGTERGEIFFHLSPLFDAVCLTCVCLCLWFILRVYRRMWQVECVPPCVCKVIPLYIVAAVLSTCK